MQTTYFNRINNILLNDKKRFNKINKQNEYILYTIVYKNHKIKMSNEPFYLDNKIGAQHYKSIITFINHDVSNIETIILDI